jgi:hypothetical protein
MDSINATISDKLQDNERSARERKKEMGAEEEMPCVNDALPNCTTIACTILTDSTKSHANEVCISSYSSLTKSIRNRGLTRTGDTPLPSNELQTYTLPV